MRLKADILLLGLVIGPQSWDLGILARFEVEKEKKEKKDEEKKM